MNIIRSQSVRAMLRALHINYVPIYSVLFGILKQESPKALLCPAPSYKIVRVCKLWD